MTSIQWSDGAPIYRQLKDRVIAMMLDGILKPGDALPSVRQVAAEYQLNPITVSRAYQELADEALVEKRRGLGMFVTDEASKKLRGSERERFLTEITLDPVAALVAQKIASLTSIMAGLDDEIRDAEESIEVMRAEWRSFDAEREALTRWLAEHHA